MLLGREAPTGRLASGRPFGVSQRRTGKCYLAYGCGSDLDRRRVSLLNLPREEGDHGHITTATRVRVPTYITMRCGTLGAPLMPYR